LRQLTHDHGNDAHPIWSPNGRWITFASSRTGWKDEGMLFGAQPYGEIGVIRADGSDVRQLTDNQWEDAPLLWLPAEFISNGR
jgi:Tol biopolymer transport system component